MALKVYKIPDLNGGITYQVQTPDGKWHLTDPQGNFLPEKKEDTADSATSIPKEKRTRKKSPSRRKDEPYQAFSMKISKEVHKRVSDYVYWRNLYKEPCSRSSVFIDAVLEFIQKDREYREFQKRNAPTL